MGLSLEYISTLLLPPAMTSSRQNVHEDIALIWHVDLQLADLLVYTSRLVYTRLVALQLTIIPHSESLIRFQSLWNCKKKLVISVDAKQRV